MGLIEDSVAAELSQWPGFKAAGLDAKKISENLAKPPRDDMGDLAFATFRFAKEQGKAPPQLALEVVAGRDTASISARLKAVPPTGGGRREAGSAPAGRPGEGAQKAGGEDRIPASHLPRPTSKLVVGVSTAGPYVNIRLNRPAVAAMLLHAIEQQGENYGDSDTGKGKTLVIDLSSPNIAKPLAVHHLRSTMIGFSIKKIRENQGWRVVGINHLGDWGTGFGKLIAGLKKYHPELFEPAEDTQRDNRLGGMTVEELNEAYRRFNQADDAEALRAGAREFALLEQFNREKLTMSIISLEGQREAWANWNVWADARDCSLRAFNRAYSRLGLKFENQAINWPASLHRSRFLYDADHTAKIAEVRNVVGGQCPIIGESAFALGSPFPEDVIERAKTSEAAVESNGALVLFPFGEAAPPVFLVKSDGATSYHVRDMASAVFRHEVLGATELAYVVGAEQQLHFKQLFAALKMIGYDWADNCTHVDFGLMLFKTDKGGWEKTSTRRGTAIMLEDLLDEAISAVREIMREKNPELAGSEDAEAIAKAVGVGAVVFNDLKNGRRNNIKFDWDAVLDFEGESGPYMLYQYVRMGSVTEKFRQAFGEPDFAAGDAALLTLDEEWRIVRLLADFPDAVAKASHEYEPSVVARHLIELASATSSWWTATRDTRIVGEDRLLSLARVRLVNAIRTTLGKGLQLLAMTPVERM